MSKIEAVTTFPTFPETARPVAKVRERGTAYKLRAVMRIASLCLLGYWLVLFIATHLPSQSMPKVAFSDKIQHLVAYAGLGFLLAWALPRQAVWHRHLTLALAAGLIYGGVDELTQKFIPGRHCDWWDFMADAAGVCCGLVAYVVLRSMLMHWNWGRELILKLSR